MSFAAMPALMLAVAAGAPERYADVLEAYRAGDATAVERVGQVPEKAIRDEIRRVQRLRGRALSAACLDCSEKRLFAAYPVHALHQVAHADLETRLRPDRLLWRRRRDPGADEAEAS